MLELALASFTKVVEQALSFPEYFESSHLDVFIPSYVQFTGGCQDWYKIQVH